MCQLVRLELPTWKENILPKQHIVSGAVCAITMYFLCHSKDTLTTVVRVTKSQSLHGQMIQVLFPKKCTNEGTRQIQLNKACIW